MSDAKDGEAFESWRPGEYVRDYYSQQVEPDEQAAIRFQVAYLQRTGRRFRRAVEYGCGPTLMRALAASAYVASLDMADWLDENLQHVRRWVSGDPQADDWSRFTEYVLRCEGLAQPSREDVHGREQLTREVIADLIVTDARQPHPLGPERTAGYDLLISGFCLDCLTESRSVWRDCVRNVFGLLEPGGAFVVLALRGCEKYRVGEQWFPGATIQAADLRSALLECGVDPARLEIDEAEVPTHADQGYTGILMASGETTARA